MNILVLTTRFPYGTWHEAFFEAEFQALAASFGEVSILPIKTGDLCRALPPNVDVWEPLASAGKWSYVRLLGHLSTWLTLAKLLCDCWRSAGPITRQRFLNCLMAACLLSALARHRKLKDFIASESPALVYSYWGHMPALAIPLAKALGARTCVRYHRVDLYLETQNNEGFIPCRREIQAATDMNVFVSQHGLEYFEDRASDTARGGRVVNRLGSPDYGPPRPRSVGDDPVVIASVSSIGGVKRVHLIARLVKELAKNRAVIWHHFGSGQCSILDDEMAQGAPENLRVKMWGDTPRAEIQKFYRANPVTFFVNLSESEGVPVSIMEALNADIPVVASNVGGTSEVVFDGRSGMLVASDDCECTGPLAQRILDALQPGGLLNESAPRRVWKELYDADANATRMVTLLREVSRELSN